MPFRWWAWYFLSLVAAPWWGDSETAPARAKRLSSEKIKKKLQGVIELENYGDIIKFQKGCVTYTFK